MEPQKTWQSPIGNSSSSQFFFWISGFNLLLLGPDGHSCLERERRMDESEVKQALCDAYNDPSKQFGLLVSDSGKLRHTFMMFHDHHCHAIIIDHYHGLQFFG